MDRTRFVAALAEALAAPADTFAPGRRLDAIPQWDSLAVVEFQALADELLGRQVPPGAIAACTTVDDLLDLLQAAPA